MGILSRILSPFVERRSAPGFGTTASFAQAFGLDPGAPGGRYLSPTGCENLSAVLAAVNAIASGVASLEPLAFRRDGAGRDELPRAHWFSRLLRAPSEHFGWHPWCEQMIADCALHGNALAEIVTDDGGRVVALEPIAWGRVSVQVLPTGRVAYDIAPPGTWRGGSDPRTRRLLSGEVLHLRDRVSGGEVVAKSRLQRAAGAVANVGALQEMSLAVWRQGVRPSGYLSTAGFLNDSQRQLMRGLLERFAGTRASGQLLLLEGSTKFEQLGIDAESAQTLESRRFGTEEIARAFQISPLFLQDWSRSTFTNSETAGRWFAQHTLAPWARRLEAAIQGAVLGAHSDVAFELDMSSLLRGSDLERWQMWKLATEIGAVDAAEVRQAESWPPRPAERQQEPAA